MPEEKKENKVTEQKEGVSNEAAFSELAKAIAELGEQRLAYRRINVALTAAIVVVFCAFAYVGYSSVKSNFTEEKLTNSLRIHSEALLPEFSDKVGYVVTESLPVYKDLVERRIEETLPLWIEKIREQLSDFAPVLGEIARKEVEKAIEEGIKEGTIGAHFHDLTDEQISKIREKFEKELRAELLDACKNVIDEASEVMVRIHDELEQFNLDNLPENERELSKMIIHHLLMLLDSEIMEEE
ncbi:MAG: hypothetical protein ABIH42_07235 [Planctomycetota bacterium]